MATQELTDGKAARPAGVYRHPVTGAEIIAVYTPKYGNPQADAYVRLGFEYSGPAPDSVQNQVNADIPNLPAVTRDDKEVREPQPAVGNPTALSQEEQAEVAARAAKAAEESAQPKEKVSQSDESQQAQKKEKTEKKGLFGRKK